MPLTATKTRRPKPPPAPGKRSAFAVARLKPDGNLDTTFDGDGKLTTPFSGLDGVYALTIGPDYKITAAGYARSTTFPFPSDMALARYKVTTALEERTYFQQDANHNVTSLADAFGSIAERYIYDPYGTQTVLTPTFTTTTESLGNTHGFQGGIQGEEKGSGIEY